MSALLMGGEAVRRVTRGKASMRNDEVLRIVVVGKTGSGKSATGNTILGPGAFQSRRAAESVTEECKEATVGTVSVVDTPGLFDTRSSEDETIKKINDCIRLAAPGPQAFLLVIKLDTRFTKEEQRSVEIIQQVFGQESDKYTMVLFTNGDQLEGTVEAFVGDCPGLQELVSKCQGRYHVFNNKAKDPSVLRSQVDELMVKINQMVLENGGSHYTNEMFQEAARTIQEEKERERREKEEKRRAEEEKVREQIREEEEERRAEEEKVREQIREGEEKRKLIGGVISNSMAAGATVGAGLGTFGGPIGTIVGAVAGLGVGGAMYGINKLIKKHRNRNTPE